MESTYNRRGMMCVRKDALSSITFSQNVIFSWTKGKGQRERTRKGARDAQQGKEAKGQTMGRTWTRSRRRPGHGRHGTGKHVAESYGVGLLL